MKWLTRNLPLILVCIMMAGIFYIGIDALIANKQYRQDIEDRNIKIAIEERKVGKLKEVNNDLMDERENAKITSDKKIAEMKDNQKKELARIESRLNKWKAKVKEMPASTVVIKIRTILKTEEVWLRPDGVLFSLTAAKDCLAILGDFSIAEERDQWRDDYFKAMNRIGDLKKIITGDEFIFLNFDAICFTKDKIIGEEREKFSLSEKRNIQSYWKGIKQGGLALGIIGFIGGLVLGK